MKLLVFMAFFARMALGEEGPASKILQVSQSGRTILVNEGHLDGLTLGAWARILGPEHPLGVAELVRIFPKQSFWYLRFPTPQKAHRKGQNIHINPVPSPLEAHVPPGPTPSPGAVLGVDPVAQERWDQMGPRWSADLSDQQLREFIVESGLEEEKRRQELAFDHKMSHEILLRMSIPMEKHTTPQDPFYQSRGYGLALGYELHWARFSRFFKGFSLEALAERAIRYYNIGQVNGRFAEGSFLVAINYYFWNLPYRLRGALLYAGVGIRGGEAKVTSPYWEKDYLYEVMGMPLFQLGAKYRFWGPDEGKKRAVGGGVHVLVQRETSHYGPVGLELPPQAKGAFQQRPWRLILGVALDF